MTRTIRILYLGRPAREKFLILILLVGLLIYWLSAFSTRLSTFVAESKHTSKELDTQAMWLHNQDRIEREAKEQAAQLDPTQTLDGPRLIAALSALANDSGLQPSIGGTTPSTTGQFTINTVEFQAQKANFGSLMAFVQKVGEKAPYISIESQNIRADADPNMLNTSLKISAVEILRH